MILCIEDFPSTYSKSDQFGSSYGYPFRTSYGYPRKASTGGYISISQKTARGRPSNRIGTDTHR